MNNMNIFNFFFFPPKSTQNKMCSATCFSDVQPVAGAGGEPFLDCRASNRQGRAALDRNLK